MPPFAPFVALVLLFSAVAALPAGLALPLGVALLAAAAAQLGAAAGRHAVAAARCRRGHPAAQDGEGCSLSAPPWLLLFLALVLGAALPERVAAALAEAARLVRVNADADQPAPAAEAGAGAIIRAGAATGCRPWPRFVLGAEAWAALAAARR